MLVAAILLAALALWLLQGRLYRAHAFDHLHYHLSLSSEEIYEGEDFFLYEELTNEGLLPLPSAKINIELPEGLAFRLRDPKTGKDSLQPYVQSAFVLPSYRNIKRRWTVSGLRRGVYTIDRGVMVASDLFGTATFSQTVSSDDEGKRRIVVLPRTVDLDTAFTSAALHSGELPVLRSLLRDPMTLAGTREYQAADPMRQINWKSTASHGRLMVNIEEYTERRQFNLLLNMQSRPIELHPETPASPALVELGITVAASILDATAASALPVRLFANTTAEGVSARMGGEDDEVGRQILVTPTYCGRGDILSALRLLASLEKSISCPFDRLLDHVLSHPDAYAQGANIVVVSPYIDERMVHFYEHMRAHGVRTIYFVTGSARDALVYPDGMEIYYKTYL